MTTVDVSGQLDAEDAPEFIERIVLDEDADSVTFEDISDEYNWLEIYVEAMISGTDNATEVRPRFNQDTVSDDYESYELEHDDSSTASIYIGGRAFDSRTSDQKNNAFIFKVEGYSNSNFVTTYRTISTLPEGTRGRIWQGWWDNTDVVTQIELNPDDEQFAEGSEFILMGFK